MPIRFVGFVDFFIPVFEIISDLGVVFIKHGLMDKRNYLKRNYSKNPKFDECLLCLPREALQPMNKVRHYRFM